MKLSKHWLQEFTTIDSSPTELAATVSASLAEVEGYKDFTGWFDGIVVGKIITINPHPNADKLQLTTVDIGQDNNLEIICGATNISVGDYVPVATTGTSLTHILGSDEPFVIEKREIRGVESNGMLCSAKELGISDDHSGILLLNDEPNIRVGEHFATVVKANDIIFEIENKALTHRPDAFSHEGMAREIATILDSEFTSCDCPQIQNAIYQQTEEKELKTDHVSVSIQDSNLCRRYSAVVLNNINVKPSPLWMQLRLRSIGVRPINNVVDVTNYVMAEIGQPLHAFDRDKLEGNSIIVRTASPQETLTTLDGTSRTLDEGMLVIADEHQAIALAGIMGGESSEIDDTTTSVVLESANFEHYNNRKTARKLGLNTEASTRFSKNQDPENTLRALNRAITLLQEYAHATIQTNIIDIYPEKRTEKTITISTDYIIDRIGDPDLTNKTDIIAILRRLDITVSEQDDNLTLTIPTFRPDLTIRADIVEEIARIKGYDNMQLTLPKRDLTPASSNPHIDWLRRAKRTLATIGCTEVYNYTFVGKELYTKCGVEEALQIELQNPISPDTTHLRPFLLPSVIVNIDTNRKHFDHVALFELEKGISPATKDDELPNETNRLALALYEHDKHHNYSDIKGMVEQLLSQLHIPEVAFSYVDEEDVLLTMFAKSRRAAVTSRGEVIGYVGELNPDVQVAFGFDGVVGIAEFNADTLYELTDKGDLYQFISVHPQLTMDISCIIDRSLSLDHIRNTLTQAGSDLLVDTEVLDADVNDQSFGVGNKAVTFRLIFQSHEHSLSKADVALDVQNVKNVLQENFAAELRS